MSRHERRLEELVRRVMDEQNLSQREVARRANALGEALSQSTVGHLQAGVVTGPEKLLAFARVVGENPDEYFRAARYPLRYAPEMLEGDEDSQS